MKEIRLYGELAEKFGKTHRFAVKSAAEALRALKANCRGFEAYMAGAHLRGTGFRVFVGTSRINEYEEIHHPAGKAKLIRLVPVVIGSKSGLFGILLGALLIGAALVAAPFTAGTSLSFIPQAVGMLGVSMVIGGVSQLLSSPPPGRDESLDRRSHLFNGPINTSLQGRAVPVIYGRMIVGSAVISAGIDTI